MAWQIETYENSGNLEKESFYETIKKYISKISPKGDIKSPENVLFPLSVFYKYEIPVRRPYIKKLSDKETIDGLLNLNEIVQFTFNSKDYLSLHHSEIARIYFDTFKYFEDFGSGLKEKN